MTTIRLFETQEVRSVWDQDKETWFFSVVDVVAVLTSSTDAGAYWRKLKQRLRAEGNETVTSCHGLKMQAADGKMRLTDVVDTEQLLRLIQTIPSPKAEPFKQWLARVGYERIEETDDPELAFDRAMETYLKKGYSKDWINQRLKSIEVRKDLTDEWEGRGVQKGQEFAILTDEITKAWSGLTTREYKQVKGLKKEGLRDHMTNLELVLKPQQPKSLKKKSQEVWSKTAKLRTKAARSQATPGKRLNSRPASPSLALKVQNNSNNTPTQS